MFALRWIFLFSCCSSAFSQQMPDSVAQKLEKLSGYEVWADENLETYITDAGDALYTFLQSSKISSWDNNFFYVSTTEDSSLNIYTFSYHSGGTAGRIYFNIAQWKNSEEAYNCQRLYGEQRGDKARLTGKPFEVINLNKKDSLLLVLNGYKGSSQIEMGSAIVLCIKNDVLKNHNKGFSGNYSELTFMDDMRDNEHCMVCISFNTKTKQLIVEDVGDLDEVNLIYNGMESKIDGPDNIIVKPNHDNKIVFEFRFSSFRLKQNP